MPGKARQLILFVVLAMACASAALAAPGGRDSSFGTNGFTVIDVPGNNEFLSDLVVLDDGKILAAGGDPGPPAPAGNLLVRLSPSGVRDQSFGNAGIQVQPDTGAGSPRSLSDIEIQADGKIAAVGLGRGPGGNDAFGFARYLPGGAPDTGFGANGIRIVQTAVSSDGLGVAPTPDGGMIGVGTQSTDQVAIVKLTPGGDPDTAFGPGGVRSLDLPGTPEFGSAVTVLDGGTILIGGTSEGGAFLAKLDASGNPVAGFGTGGIATFNLSADPTDPTGEIFALVPLPGGGVAAAGDNFLAPGDREAIVLKVLANGNPDPNFGANGQVHLNPTTTSDSAFDLVRVEDRLLVAGEQGERVWLFRLLRNGALDPTFGSGGETVHQPANGTGSAAALAVQADGRPLIAGTAIPDGANFNQLLVGRFKADTKCFGKLPTVLGTSGPNVLRGTRRRDVIVGLGGGDVIKSFAGRDLICSGAGPDRVFSGRGRDRIDAGPGNPDRCDGGPGRDQLLRCERRR